MLNEMICRHSHKHSITGAICLILLLLSAQEVWSNTPAEETAEAQNTTKNAVFTGCSGGMMLHIGYLFAPSAEALWCNQSISGENLPKHGATYGIGGAARVHFLDCIHLGTEGFVSTMPMLHNGSQVRNGWGGILLDYYWTCGKIRPLVGFTIGGGATRRTYIPANGGNTVSSDGTIYNASFQKTPFGFVDPYVGLEYALTPRVALLFRIDYILPFGKQATALNEDKQQISYMTPSGPRLYIGFQFGHHNR